LVVFTVAINPQAIAGKTKRAIGLWPNLVQDFIIPGTNPGKESVFKQHLINSKHFGNHKFFERHFKEVAKLCLIFGNNKYCLEKVKKCFGLGSTIVILSGNQ
jgi:hypothetical protein